DGLGQRLPLIATRHGTFETARKVVETRGLLSTGSQRKIDLARSLFEAGIDGSRLREAVDVARASVVTPLMFEYDLVERAKADPKRIVLPEGSDDRILRATSTPLARETARITALGGVQGGGARRRPPPGRAPPLRACASTTSWNGRTPIRSASCCPRGATIGSCGRPPRSSRGRPPGSPSSGRSRRCGRGRRNSGSTSPGRT